MFDVCDADVCDMLESVARKNDLDEREKQSLVGEHCEVHIHTQGLAGEFPYVPSHICATNYGPPLRRMVLQ